MEMCYYCDCAYKSALKRNRMHMKNNRMPTSFKTFIVEVYAICMVSTLLFGQTNILFCLEVIEVTSIMLHLFIYLYIYIAITSQIISFILYSSVS